MRVKNSLQKRSADIEDFSPNAVWLNRFRACFLILDYSHSTFNKNYCVPVFFPVPGRIFPWNPESPLYKSDPLQTKI